MSSPKTVLGKYLTVSPVEHLTAAVVAVLEYAGQPHAEDSERPSMWPYAEDLWTSVCQQTQIEQLALVARMIQHARNRLSPTVAPAEPEAGDDT